MGASRLELKVSHIRESLESSQGGKSYGVAVEVTPASSVDEDDAEDDEDGVEVEPRWPPPDARSSGD